MTLTLGHTLWWASREMDLVAAQRTCLIVLCGSAARNRLSSPRDPQALVCWKLEGSQSRTHRHTHTPPQGEKRSRHNTYTVGREKEIKKERENSQTLHHLGWECGSIECLPNTKPRAPSSAPNKADDGIQGTSRRITSSKSLLATKCIQS